MFIYSHNEANLLMTLDIHPCNSNQYFVKCISNYYDTTASPNKAAITPLREGFIDLFTDDVLVNATDTNYTLDANSTVAPTTTIFDPCASGPCQNFGVCSSSGSSFSCICTQSFRGDTCEKFRPCDNAPCQNNATCWLKGSDSNYFLKHISEVKLSI